MKERLIRLHIWIFFFQNNLPHFYFQRLIDSYVGIWYLEDRASWYILTYNKSQRDALFLNFILYNIELQFNDIVYVYIYIYIFIYLLVCLMTGPKPLPKSALHTVRSRASSFKWEYPHLTLRSSSSFLRLLPCLPVTSIPPSIFPSVTRCRRQFRRKMWPIQFAFLLRISCRIFLCSLTLSNTS